MAGGYSDLMQKQPTTPEIFVMTFATCATNQQASQTVFSSSSSSSSSSCVSGVFFSLALH
jgi:hypothetical protein